MLPVFPFLLRSCKRPVLAEVEYPHLVKSCFSTSHRTMSISVNKVLLLDNVDPAANTILASKGIDSTLFKDKLTTDELVAKLQDYEGVVIRSATKLTADIISKCPNLKVIGRAGTGVDNIDIPAATKHGVIVMNTPGGNTMSAAEHTCTLIACMSRNLPAANISMKEGKWERKAFMGHELYGKTLAIIGLGRIGREVASRMHSFGMKTIGFDPMVTKEDAAKSGIEWLGLDEIWPQADYITVHTPLIPQTRGLLNKESFGKCKKGVRVVNCARGGIIDETDLLEALNSGQCGGAGLDVFVEEPPTNLELVKHANVVAAPHLGASTKEAQSRCGREIAEQIADVCNSTSFFGVLNAPALNQVQSKEMKDKCETARYLGSMMASFNKSSSPASITVRLSEADLKNGRHGVKASVCAGLASAKEPSVNVVNSIALSEQHGYEVALEANSKQTDGVEVLMKSGNENISLVGCGKSGLCSLDSINGKVFSSPVMLNQKCLVFKTSNVSADLTKALSDVGKAHSIHMTTCDGDNWVVVGFDGDQKQSSSLTNACFYAPK